MDLSDLMQFFKSSGSIITAIIGALIALFFFLRWLVTRHVTKLDDEIARLHRANESLTNKAERADNEQTRANRLQIELDVIGQKSNAAEGARIQAETEREDAKRKCNEVTITAWKWYKAWKIAKGKREKAEQESKKLGLEAQKFRIEAKEKEDKALTELDKAKTAQNVAESAVESLEEKLRIAVDNLAQANDKIKLQANDLERYEAQIDSIARQDGRLWCAPVRAPIPRFVPLAERRLRRPLVISVLNLKGGVGKTTLTANLAGYLSHHREKWVLALDLDHQRSLTQLMFNTRCRINAAEARRTIQDFLLSSSRNGSDLRAAAEQVQGFERCWVVGNSDVDTGHGLAQNLDDLEMALLARWLLRPEECDVRYLFRNAIHSELFQDRFEYVLIDCPPRLTTASINALAASDFVLIPTQPQHISASSVSHLLRRLRVLCEAGVFPNLNILGILGNRHSTNADTQSRERKLLDNTSAAASHLWGRPVRLLNTSILASDYYSRYQNYLADDGVVQFPSVAVKAITAQYESLTSEIEGRIHECLGND